MSRSGDDRPGGTWKTIHVKHPTETNPTYTPANRTAAQKAACGKDSFTLDAPEDFARLSDSDYSRFRRHTCAACRKLYPYAEKPKSQETFQP